MKRRSTLPEPAPLAIQAGLEAYEAPLDRFHAAHLLRRTGFGVAPARLADALGQSAQTVVDGLVKEALFAAMPPRPAWADNAPPPRGAPRQQREAYDDANQDWKNEWIATWFTDMLGLGLRERMTLFWHNHFVTEYRVYDLAPYAYRYTTVLRRHALGNAKDLVREVGFEPAMLLYLNGAQNRARAPNENYARELCELFTMGPVNERGVPNYSQEDIEEIARALTGWTIDRSQLAAVFRPNRFDGRDKTIFGQTANWDYDGVVDLLFTVRRRAIAVFLARKLYREFVYAAPDETVVDALAELFIRHDFEIAPVLSVLLSSAHFFDDQVIGARVKSPVELLVGLLCDLDATPTPLAMDRLRVLTKRLKQSLLNPPNVAGWPGHHTWLSTTAIVERWTVTGQMINRFTNDNTLDLTALAETLYDPDGLPAVFAMPVALAEHLLSVPLDLLDLPTANLDFAGDLINNPLPRAVADGPAYVRNLTKLLLDGIPWYEWDLARPNVPRYLRNYVRALINLPAFQLT